MKTRMDFVTNSSSSSFIIAYKSLLDDLPQEIRDNKLVMDILEDAHIQFTTATFDRHHFFDHKIEEYPEHSHIWHFDECHEACKSAIANGYKVFYHEFDQNNNHLETLFNSLSDKVGNKIYIIARCL